MISQLLVFARKGMTRFRPLPLKPFINEALKLARAAVPENIALQRRLSAADMTVEADAGQLQQALMHLLGNAVDALADAERPEISVCLDAWEADEAFLAGHPGLKARRFARLSVRDNGCGIPAAHLDNIFEPFFTTKGVGKGSGLGLSMVYGAVSSHGGVVTVESEPGAGACFRIFLPLAPPRENPPHPVDADMAGGQGELILLADDEAEVRGTCREVLESLGYRVLEAADGRQAVEVFSAHGDEIALVVLDVVMPEMGGVEAAERMRERQPEVPVIFATGYDRQQVAGDHARLPRSRLVGKPFAVSELHACIREMLAGNA